MILLRKVKIKDLGKVFTGSTPPTKDDKMWGGKHLFVKPSDLIKGSRRVFDTETKLSDGATQTSKGRLLPVGTTCVVTIGTIGKLCQLDKPSATNQQINSIVVDKEKYDQDYVYYLMTQSINRVKVVEGGSASGREHVKKSTFEEIELEVLPLAEQVKVSHLVKKYDNLIENNNRRIAILEEMAQSLYREWFVNFRYPGHADALDASSPNALNENQGKPKLIDSPLGQIPEGWEVKSAAEAITINPKTKLVKDGDKPFVGMSGLSQGSMVIGDIIEKTGNSGAKFINGDTLFARITPCLQNGKTGYVQFLTPEQPVGFGSTEFIVLRESECLSSEFIYLLSRSNNFREHAIQSMTGATGRQRVHNDCFTSCYLPVPPKELMNEFTKLVKPMFKSIFNLSKRNENLKQQRDMLLPKLISGQIEL
jgi:type I restriction enzyme S subunit